MNVLIVDDEPQARERLSRLVSELEGYTVLEPSATTGEEALRCAADNNRVARGGGAAGGRHFYLCQGWLSALPPNASGKRLEAGLIETIFVD